MKLAFGRASLSKLLDIQCETERALSDLRFIIAEWAPQIDKLRTQQESKLRERLTNFERVANENAKEAISLQLQPLTMVGAIQPLFTSCF